MKTCLPVGKYTFLYFNTRPLLVILLGLFLLCTAARAEDAVDAYRPQSKSTPAVLPVTETGQILASFDLRSSSNLGVTVVDNKIVVSAAGASTSSADDNYFYRYELDGTLIDSFPQGSTAGWGFRDLAYDGQYILASDNEYVRKIDPNTFQIVSSVQNDGHTVHRGLAYDNLENAIYSTNFSNAPMIRFNASTGATIHEYGYPEKAPYGIALDKFSNQDKMYLWFAEPSWYGEFNLSRVDTASGNIEYTLELAGQLPDSVTSGGLEIINNHPDYSGKTIAVMLVQCRLGPDKIAYVDITDTPELPHKMERVDHFGGWLNDAAVEGNFAYLSQGHSIQVLDISQADFSKVSTVPVIDEGGEIVSAGDYLYFAYSTWSDHETEFEIYDISQPDTAILISHKEIPSVDGIDKIEVSGEYAYFHDNAWDNERVIIFDISDPVNPDSVAVYDGNIGDFTVSGNYLYGIQDNSKAINQLQIVDVSNPQNMQLVGSVDINTAHRISVYGQYAYISCHHDNGFRIYDVSNPAAPVFLSSYPGGNISFTEIISDNMIAYVQESDTDLHIFDVSDKSNPQLLSSNEYSTFRFVALDVGKLYVAMDGQFKTLDVLLPNAPLISQAYDVPATLNGIAREGNKIYVTADEKLWIFDATDPAALDLLSTTDAADGNKVFVNNGYAYISDLVSNVMVYSVSNPAAVQYQKTLDVGAPVISMTFQGNTAYAVSSNATFLKVLDNSDPANLSVQQSVNLAGNGQDLLIPNGGSTLFVGYETDDKASHGVQLFDISTPSAPSSLGSFDTYDTPRSLGYTNNTIIVASYWDEYPYSYLEAYVDAGGNNYIRQKSQYLTGSSRVADMEISDGIIILTLPELGCFLYIWDPTTLQFMSGPNLELPSPHSIVTLPADSKDDNAAVYTYSISGSGSGLELYGSLGLYTSKITKNPPPAPQPETVQLKMQINPTNALGCSTTPAVGTYDYNIQTPPTTVNLKANDNQADGWFFKEWSRDASGTSPTTNIQMDADKVAQANFVELLLGVSGSKDKMYMCPDSAQANPINKMPIYLEASQDDDWKVGSIGLKPGGNGNDANDIDRVEVKYNNAVIFSGKFPADDGKLTASFSPQLTVPAGQQITLQVVYHLKKDTTYAYDAVKKFTLKTEGVAATPVHYPQGLILGAARADTMYVYRVITSTNKMFASIQEAVRASTEGDIIYVCPGYYRENIEVFKGVTIKSKKGADKTKLIGKDDYLKYTLKIRCDNVTIDGFTIIPLPKCTGLEVTISYNCEKSKNILVKNNIFIQPLSAQAFNIYANNSIIEENKLISKVMTRSQETGGYRFGDLSSNENLRFRKNDFDKGRIKIHCGTYNSEFTENRFFDTDYFVLELWAAHGNTISDNFNTNMAAWNYITLGGGSSKNNIRKSQYVYRDREQR